MDRLYLRRLIAAGANGVLFQGLDIMDGNPYAVKIMIPKAQTRQEFRNEIAAFDHLSRYPNCNKYIVCLYGNGRYKGSRKKVFSKEFRQHFKQYSVTKNKRMTPVSGDYLYLKMEMMDMDLFSLVDFILAKDSDENYDIPWIERHPDIVKHLLYELLQALNILHSLGVAHLDIKLENILVKFAKHTNACEFYENPQPEVIQLKIGDLGFTCTDRKHRTEKDHLSKLSLCKPQGTPETTAPEIIGKSIEDPESFLSIEEAQKADIWSMGITFGEILFEPDVFKIPQAAEEYWENGDLDTFITTFNSFIEGEDQVEYESGDVRTDNVVTDVFYDMLTYDPEDRSTVKEAINMLFGL